MTDDIDNRGWHEFRSLAERTSVVLVGPRNSGNIGAVARAMHNFGFGDLRIAERHAALDDTARRRAVNSEHVLDAAGIFETLGAALAGADIAVAATRRMGRHRCRVFTPREMAEAMAQTQPSKKIAVVFGPEDTGLLNEHLDRCNWIVAIPGGSTFDSLNLSHAVAVILYEIRSGFLPTINEQRQKSENLAGLYEHIERALRRIGFIPENGDPLRAMPALRKMISRGNWSRNEIDLFHAILKKIESYSAQE